jgi:hypothetical protein
VKNIEMVSFKFSGLPQASLVYLKGCHDLAHGQDDLSRAKTRRSDPYGKVASSSFEIS